MIDRYFKFDNKSKTIYFNSKSLKVFIPTRYDRYKGCLVIEDKVTTLGIFSMLIDGKVEELLFIPGIITMDYNDMTKVVLEDGLEYLELTLKKGDKFMHSSEIVKLDSLGFVLFKEFIDLGKYPKGINYDNAYKLFDNLKAFVGIDFHVDRTVLEIIYSHLYRDPTDLSTLYRQTNMNKKPIVIPMRSVAHSALSTTGRLVGSYLNSTMDSSIVNKSKQNSEIEDILRQ